MTPFRPTKPFYSPGEIAEIADLHPSTILNYIKSGKLYAVKLSERTYRIPARAAWMLLDPQSVAAPEIVIHDEAEVDIREADQEPGLVDA